MIYFGMAFVGMFASLFGWLASKALRTKILHGLGWSAAQADKPMTFWLGVGAYLLNATVGLFFLVMLFAAVLEPRVG